MSETSTGEDDSVVLMEFLHYVSHSVLYHRQFQCPGRFVHVCHTNIFSSFNWTVINQLCLKIPKAYLKKKSQCSDSISKNHPKTPVNTKIFCTLHDFNPFCVFQTPLVNYHWEDPMVTFVAQMYANTCMAQTGATLVEWIIRSAVYFRIM